jgi:hypothetical protein
MHYEWRLFDGTVYIEQARREIRLRLEAEGEVSAVIGHHIWVARKVDYSEERKDWVYSPLNEQLVSDLLYYRDTGDFPVWPSPDFGQALLNLRIMGSRYYPVSLDL